MDLEEETIIEYIFDLDSQPFPPRIQKVEDIANQLLKNRNVIPIGKQ